MHTVYPKKYAHVFCFAVLCCGYTLTDFPISIRLTSLALWQSNDCPSASKATLVNMDKYFMRIHYERLHNHNKAKHNTTVCIFLGIYCRFCLSSDTFLATNCLLNFHNKTNFTLRWLEISSTCLYSRPCPCMGYIGCHSGTFIHKWLHLKGHFAERHPKNYTVAPFYTMT